MIPFKMSKLNMLNPKIIYNRMNIYPPKRFVFGFELLSGRKTACNYLSQKNNGIVLNNKQLHGVYMGETQDSIMRKLLTNCSVNRNTYVVGVYNIEQFNTFRDNGFITVKINRTIENFFEENLKSYYVIERQLRFLPEYNWDVVIQNNGCINNFYSVLDHLDSEYK
jgi:hypothetical protein